MSMSTPTRISWTRRVGAALGAAALCHACTLGLPRDLADDSIRAAWIELGPEGVPIARAIVGGSRCPDIVVDGRAEAMRVRAMPATIPLRPTQSAPADSKPSAFPVATCELDLPRTATRAVVGDRALPLPIDAPQRIVVLGDSGCRLKKSDDVWQRCDNLATWPFARIAEMAAAQGPDLVIHVGDYHYRENGCPATIPGCAGSPWGYGFDAWNADFFVPAAPLLASAPWIMVRGNHEECARAGQGWFRFLDPYPFEARRSCDDPANDVIANYSPTYRVPLGRGLQVLVFDSAKVGYDPLAATDPQYSAYRTQFEQADALARTDGVTSIFANHHPLLAFVPRTGTPPLTGNAALQSVAAPLFGTRYFPERVELAVHGHMHDFQAIGFATGQPATLVAGMGGDVLDVELPDPFPSSLPPAPGTKVNTIAHRAHFGFVLLERGTGTWTITAYGTDGVPFRRCTLVRRKLDCGSSGLSASN